MVTLCLLAVGLAATEPPCEVDWRGVSLRDAIAQISSKMGTSAVIDSSVTAAQLETPVRLVARHLTCEQVARWLARYAGLEAVIVDGSPVLAGAGRMPVEWRGKGLSSDELHRTVRGNGRSTDIRWGDTPLSRVAADIAGAFDVDVLFSPEIIEEAPLIDYEAPGVDLESVCEALAEALGAAHENLDGAIWFHPRLQGAGAPSPASQASGAASQPSVARGREKQGIRDSVSAKKQLEDDRAGSRPASSTRASPQVAEVESRPSGTADGSQSPRRSSEPDKGGPTSGSRPGGGTASASSKPLSASVREPLLADGVLKKRVRIDRSVSSWAEFGTRVQVATGIPCRVHGGPAPYPGIEASGAAIDVLEAARLAGWLTWKVVEPDSDAGLSLQVTVKQGPVGR